MTGALDARGRALRLAGLADPEATRRRFLARVLPSVDSPGCLDWTGAMMTAGYGVMRVKSASGTSHNYGAHRIAWLLAGHTLPGEGMVLRHTCDRPCCVNAAHLVTGTVRDNAWDREQRGRGEHVRGEDHGRARLTAAQVLTLRATGRGRWGADAAAARQLGVDRAALVRARAGESWRTLPLPGDEGWLQALTAHGLTHLGLVKRAG